MTNSWYGGPSRPSPASGRSRTRGLSKADFTNPLLNTKSEGDSTLKVAESIQDLSLGPCAPKRARLLDDSARDAVAPQEGRRQRKTAQKRSPVIKVTKVTLSKELSDYSPAAPVPECLLRMPMPSPAENKLTALVPYQPQKDFLQCVMSRQNLGEETDGNITQSEEIDDVEMSE